MNQTLTDSDLARINRYALQPLSAAEVHTRCMRLCSDQLSAADWGRFSRTALERIAALLPGEAVLCGHDKTTLPIGRFYRAETIERMRNGVPVTWVRAWFYWLRHTDGATDLARRIDGGIYREVSVSWRFRAAECSICHGNIRTCGHTPGRLYDNRRCTFRVDDVVDVLEGSIVYRAADRNARFDSDDRHAVALSPADRQIAGLCRMIASAIPRNAPFAIADRSEWLAKTLDTLGLRVVPDPPSSTAGRVLLLSDISNDCCAEALRLQRPDAPVAVFVRMISGKAESQLDALCEALLQRGYAIASTLRDPIRPAAWCAVVARKED